MTSSNEQSSRQEASDSVIAFRGLVAISHSELLPLREAMRDLQICVADYYSESARGGDLGPLVRRFLVAAQTLNELFWNGISNSATYRELFGAQRHRAAELLEGVKFARNVVQHVLHIVRPSDKVTLVGGVLGMRIYAVWDEIPAEVVAQLRPATQRLERAYIGKLRDQEVTGTMMCVLRFFAEVSPEIVHRDSRNEWTGFPLLSQPGMNTPLHPDEPEGMEEANLWMNGRAPGGDCRLICGQVTLNGVPYIYGQTFVGRLSFAPFVESVEQANYDIGLGYPYLVGEIAANFEDVSEQFPEALQGPVFASRGEVPDWATPIANIASVDDWHASGVDHASWTRVVRLEIDPQLPKGFTFGPRRARRLNSLVPPR